MKTKNLIIGLSAVVVFQLLVLMTEYLNAIYPLWTGQEIKLKTVPFDPRSMFRGNYARLRYEISNIDGKDINKQRSPRNGEVVYVKLKANEEGVYSYNGSSLNKPQNGTYIRGRIQTNRVARRSGSRSTSKSVYHVEYGIEAYFSNKEKALKIEKELRDGGFARVMIAKNGKAALKEIFSE